jgi:hypothetical protein
MNSNRTKAMDMPPCDVLAMDVRGFGDLFQIGDESGPRTRFQERQTNNCRKPHEGAAVPYAIFSG